jgi:hypothetical protein
MKKMLLAFLSSSLMCFGLISCSTPKSYVLPEKDQYQGYKIIDSVDKDTISVKIDKEDKIAVVLRDISTTSYSYLEPRFNNSMVRFDGKSQCCQPQNGLVGNSGLIVYKFSFIGKGTTSINIIARQKGLSTTANGFDTDHIYQTTAEVK